VPLVMNVHSGAPYFCNRHYITIAACVFVTDSRR
jgi:hypothetical protein